MERSVFERSAFVRQLGLAVSADDALEKRLASLVTTGEETVSAAETARRLRDRKNRLRHNKTGLIPEANAQLAAVEASLAQHQLAAQQQQTLRARQQELAVRRAGVCWTFGPVWPSWIIRSNCGRRSQRKGCVD